MPQQAELIATLAAPPSAEGEELRALYPEVQWLEVRADKVGDLDPHWLRDRFPGRLLYTLRSHHEEGGHRGPQSDRSARLAAAARSYDRVDLEADRDLLSHTLEAIPPAKRLLSWHGPPTPLTELQTRLDAMSATEAALYKLIPAAKRSGEEVAPLVLLQSQKRTDVVAFSSGDVGMWTRLMAPYLGAPVVYGALGQVPGAPGQMSIARLVEDYGLPTLRKMETCFGIVGRPVGHSLSPRLHNGAYRALGIQACYFPFHGEGFDEFWREIVEGNVFGNVFSRPLKGLSVTAPFKKPALSVAAAASTLARQSRSANTLVSNHGRWEAETTDPQGVVAPLEHRGLGLAGRRAAVLGCGGAGRAAAAGLNQAGAKVTLVNRTPANGQPVAESLGLPFVALSGFRPGDFELLIHATPLGQSHKDELPFAVERLAPRSTVVDLVYASRPTRLIEDVRRAGCLGVDGREVLLYQALGQFSLMTGRELPVDLGRRLLGLEASP